VANAQDLTGSDPFALNLAIHVNVFAATEILALDAVSDVFGSGFAPAPVPNVPSLAGLDYFAQVIYVEPASFECSNGLFGFVSSKGLEITIQP
jgi:hypothetical protein